MATNDTKITVPTISPKTQIALIEPSHAADVGGQLAQVDMNAEVEPYSVVEHDSGARIAVVPIHGYLAHRSNMHFPGFYTGYNFIQNAALAADADPGVDGIAFDVNSGGGMVHGAFEAANVIRSLNKPTMAIVDASAYSAAYLLSSAANRIVLPKTGGAGSIGVVTMHVDMSKSLEDFGVKITMLYAGARKVDGNPFEELSPEARERIENRLETSYNLFVETVADNRKVDATVIKNTEAGIYEGDTAVEVGLVDAVMPPAEAYTAFANELSKNTDGGIIMADKQTQGSATQPDTEALKQEGVTSERQRISSILGCDEAEGRSDLANHLAFKTDMDIDAAKSILGASEKQTEAPDEAQGAGASSPFEAAMAAGNPGIEADADADGGQETEMSDSDRILADLKHATGIGAA